MRLERTVSSIALAALALSAWANGHVIARLAPSADARAIARSAGVKLVDLTVGAPFALFRVAANDTLEAAEERLKLTTGVVWAEEEEDVDNPEGRSGSRGSTIGVIGDRHALYAQNMGLLNQIGFSPALANSAGRTVRVGVLDTGISPNQGRLWRRVVATADFVNGARKALDVPTGTDSNLNGVPDEGYGHGTFVMGLLEQMAPQCRFVVVRVADSDGVSTAWLIVKGIAFAVSNGCEVVNISMGAINEIPALDDVIEWAEHTKDTLVIAPAGNDNSEAINFPAHYGESVSVAGVDELDQKALFSNFHAEVTCCAPATGVYSAWPDGTMGIWSGTSFAAPLVTGAIADALRRRNTPAHSDDLKQAVSNSGDDIGFANPAFAEMLGSRLNIVRLNATIQALPNR